MRTGISFTVSSSDRQRLEAIIRDPKTSQKHAWRAGIILRTADGFGTSAIMATTGKSKTTVTPTSCSWLNTVEGFFAKLTRRRLKHGVFHSLVDLQAAINRFIKEHNDNPKPFNWKADPDEIIAAVKRGFQTLESIH